MSELGELMIRFEEIADVLRRHPRACEAACIHVYDHGLVRHTGGIRLFLDNREARAMVIGSLVMAARKRGVWAEPIADDLAASWCAMTIYECLSEGRDIIEALCIALERIVTEGTP